MRFGDSLLPLFAVNLSKGLPSDPMSMRYMGVAYHINRNGEVATCSHIVKSLLAGESLIGVEMRGNSQYFELKDFRCHPRYDFAVARVERRGYEVVPIHGGRDISIGEDVLSYGFTSGGIMQGKLVTVPRIFKGHVVRIHDLPVVPDARSTCELSYPSHNGFSGTPVLFNRPRTSLAGMLFSNYESTITLHKNSETVEPGKVYSEEIYKVIELGIAHTAFDVRCFLRDLDVDKVALDTPNPDPLD
ncbi:serine protease [Pseudomonas asiatica]|uniref:serine protease n=1 Tax=Pseudomonas asiatica TaxID=2219225 RepID=UPI0037C516F9